MKKIAVLSGKGGVGKTTMAASLAKALVSRGFKTGFLDSDLTGPNALDIFGGGELVVVDDCFEPSDLAGLRYVSIAQIVSREEPVLWSGEDFKSAAVQLLERTRWDVEYLVVDFPPGTGAEPQVLLPMMDYAVIVTIPSHLSESNVRRTINMCREHGVPILGLVKNMVGLSCPKCGTLITVFPEDHSFGEYGIPTLAEFPLDPQVAKDKLINDFPVDRFLRAMDHPVVLKRRRMRSSLLKSLRNLLRGG